MAFHDSPWSRSNEGSSCCELRADVGVDAVVVVGSLCFSDVSLVNVQEREETVSPPQASILCLIIWKESFKLAISSLDHRRAKAIMAEQMKTGRKCDPTGATGKGETRTRQTGRTSKGV